jgi:GDP/UDP-N,N'-diacetylbacillosamine 2-epimerase (hydrolysing)
MSIEEFQNKFNVNLDIPTILCTFHPETVSFENNKNYIKELLDALSELIDFQILITLPNMDTMGSYIRNQIIQYAERHQHFLVKESLGTIGYLTAMRYCAFLLGNTSSGFVEASVFPKKVINLGERQSGRILTSNIVQCNVTKSEILKAVSLVEEMPVPQLELTYGNGTTSDQIINILKNGL